MPNLILSNSLSQPSGGPKSDEYKINEAFGTDEGIFLDNNANLATVLGTFNVTATSNNGSGYATVSNIIPYTTYTYSVKLVAKAAVGTTTIAIGDGVNDTTYANVSATSNGNTYTGTFVPTISTITLSLIVGNSGRVSKWDDIKLYEDF